MAEHGHGNHWECVEELENVLQNIMPAILEEGTITDSSEIFADCFENENPSKTIFYSISDENELTTKILVATNKKEQTNEVVTSYPFIQAKNNVRLTITAIDEWQNLFEAVLTGKTENGQSISFFDTNYFLHKETYEIGNTYNFSIFALGYNVEVLKENTFSFEGQEAIDWSLKIGEEPEYDDEGNVKPVIFHLNEFVALMPIDSDFPEDYQFQSPIKSIDTIRAFNKDFYKVKITAFRDPDIEVYLYCKTEFFEKKPEVNEAINGVIWLQGYKN